MKDKLYLLFATSNPNVELKEEAEHLLDGEDKEFTGDWTVVVGANKYQHYPNITTRKKYDDFVIVFMGEL